MRTFLLSAMVQVGLVVTERAASRRIVEIVHEALLYITSEATWRTDVRESVSPLGGGRGPQKAGACTSLVLGDTELVVHDQLAGKGVQRDGWEGCEPLRGGWSGSRFTGRYRGGRDRRERSAGWRPSGDTDAGRG